MLGQLDSYFPPDRPRGFLACAGPNPNMRFGAFNSTGVAASGCGIPESQVYNDFSAINASSGIKSQASYTNVGTYLSG